MDYKNRLIDKKWKARELKFLIDPTFLNQVVKTNVVRALVGALVNNPSIILADEPTGELDSKTSLEIIDMLKKLNQEENKNFFNCHPQQRSRRGLQEDHPAKRWQKRLK